MTTQTQDKPKRKVMQIRTTDEFERQVEYLMNGTTIRKKSDVVFTAVQEMYDRRVRNQRGQQQDKPA